MKFIDLHAHSMLSYGVDTQKRMVFHAQRLGVELGLCDGKRCDRPMDVRIAELQGCPQGIEIKASNKNELKNRLANSKDFDYVIVHGGDEHINRLAVSDKRVDILAHPERGRRDSGVDPFIARQAKKNNVSIEVNLRNLIFTRGNHRVNALKNVKRHLMLSRKYGSGIIVTSGARSRLELRSGEGVSQLLKLLGFNETEREAAMVAVPRSILEKKNFEGVI
ncbi:MAG: RNase P subunit p30 family protein [Candidatus Hydrothermarchaeaceae archaeon]